MYGAQKTLFALFNSSHITASPVLFLLVALYWIIPLAVVFPSGALIVVSRPHASPFKTKVPIFDPEFTGNGTLDDSLQFSLLPKWDMYTYHTLEGP